MFGASEKTILYAWNYMKIYVCGTFFVQMALGLNAFINAQEMCIRDRLNSAPPPVSTIPRSKMSAANSGGVRSSTL